MPIYEFYCPDCHVIFNFYSRAINTSKHPLCPVCKSNKMERQMSAFSFPRNRGAEEEDPITELDESKMENALNLLAKEAENIDENDPRQAARLMRRLADMTGINPGPGIEELMGRMEAGEDLEDLGPEMDKLLENEEPFEIKKKAPGLLKKRPPKIDDKLYEL